MARKTLLFELFQRLGIHVLRNSYSNPIPDTRELASKKDFWDKESELAGIDMNLAGQLKFLRQILPAYMKECSFPVNRTNVNHEYYTNNYFYGFKSAVILHCIIRHFKPKSIIEVGSGFSTYVSARAIVMNEKEGHRTDLTAIEPYPNSSLRNGFPGLSRVVAKKVEDVEMGLFLKLKDNDILFVDSSHVVKTGNDVSFLYLDMFPRLKKGVLIHIHDVFFPFPYPREWVLEERRFWNEQYLLQAFLIGNISFEVVWSENYMKYKAPRDLELAFGDSMGINESSHSNSFWMRKVI